MIAKLQRLQFGSKSEKLDPQQQVLGFEPAADVAATAKAARIPIKQ